MMINNVTLECWKADARRDDWHTRFVGGDIRTMIAEIEYLREALKKFMEWGTRIMTTDEYKEEEIKAALDWITSKPEFKALMEAAVALGWSYRDDPRPSEVIAKDGWPEA
jgi:hypothetical protein